MLLMMAVIPHQRNVVQKMSSPNSFSRITFILSRMPGRRLRAVRVS